MPAPPSTDNYQLGAGTLHWSSDDGVTFRDLGNVPSAIWTPTANSIKHYSSRSGTRKLDKIFLTELSATLKIQMEETTAENFALFALGTVDEDTGGDSTVKAMETPNIEGIVKFVGTNDYGLKIDFFAKVNITPSGQYDFLSAAVNVTEITAECLEDTTPRAESATGYGLGWYIFHDGGVTA